MISTVMVACTLCTTTRSIISWKKIGLASASACSVSAATITSPKARRCRRNSGINHFRLNGWLASAKAYLRLIRMSFSVPDLFEFGAIPELEALIGRQKVANHDLGLFGVLADAGEDDGFAVAQHEDCGQRLAQPAEPAPGHANELGGEPNLARHLDEIAWGERNIGPGGGDLNQVAVGKFEAMEPRNSAEAGNARYG